MLRVGHLAGQLGVSQLFEVLLSVTQGPGLGPRDSYPEGENRRVVLPAVVLAVGWEEGEVEDFAACALCRELRAREQGEVGPPSLG